MKKLSKILVIVMVLSLVCCVLFACGNKEPENATINITIPDGAPTLAMAKLMKDFSYKDYDINYEIVSGTSEIGAKMTQGQTDISIVPTNMASILYANGLDIKLLSSNVFGLLYIMGNGDVNATSLSDMDGKTIYCIGQGGTPDFVLQYLLQENNINATIIYVASGTDVIPLLMTKKAEFAVLGEPAATMSVSKAGAKVLFDMQEEWEKLTQFNGYPQASTVVRSEIVETYPGFVKAFYEAMEENISYIENEENLEELTNTLKDNGSAVVFSSTAVIKKCNMRVEDCATAKASIVNYLSVLKDFNPATIGGELPDDAFYYNISK
ncbi:MAG: ABC transporter substrate-binding protein [Clostridia bacterium]